jgi:hypothetical protein
MHRKILWLSGVLWLIVITQVKADTCGISLPLLRPDGVSTNLQTALQRQDPCSLAVRLDSFRLWLLSHARPCSTVVADVQARNRTLLDTTVWPIDTTGMIFAGDTRSPEKIVMYISMTCPLCKRLYKEMHAAVTSGPLKGIATVGVKPFTTTPLDIAMLAAARWKKQAELLLSIAPIETRLNTETVLHILDSLGAPSDTVRKQLEDPGLQSYAQASRSEAVANGVKVTPAFFINRHRYRSYKDTQWVVDAVLFRHVCMPHVRRAPTHQ